MWGMREPSRKNGSLVWPGSACVCMCVAHVGGEVCLVKSEVVRLATWKGRVTDFGWVIEGKARESERDVLTARNHPPFSGRKWMTCSNRGVRGEFTVGTVDRGVIDSGTRKEGEVSVESLKGKRERTELPDPSKSLLLGKMDFL